MRLVSAPPFKKIIMFEEKVKSKIAQLEEEKEHYRKAFEEYNELDETRYLANLSLIYIKLRVWNEALQLITSK